MVPMFELYPEFDHFPAPSQHHCLSTGFLQRQQKISVAQIFFVVNSYETPLRMHQCMHMNVAPICDMNSGNYLQFFF